MRSPLLTACILVALAVPVHAGDITSVYTKLDFKQGCQMVKRVDEGESVSMLCQGYKDYPVHFAEGDLRQAADFICSSRRPEFHGQRGKLSGNPG